MHSEIVAQGLCVWQLYIPGLYDKAEDLAGHARKLGQLLDPQLCPVIPIIYPILEQILALLVGRWKVEAVFALLR